MASLIDPRCATPLFAMTDGKLPETCGKLDGYVMFGVFSIIVTILCVIVFATAENRLAVILVTAVVIGLLYLLVPLMQWLNVRRWLGYNEQVKAFIAKGFSKEDAMKNVQALYQTGMQASAITMAGSMIAGTR